MTRILVIEDVEQMRDNIAETLEYENYTVFKAENGRLGVESARKLLPDLIICDVMMPELDGHGVLLELRSQPTTASIPFIFLTALFDKTAIRSGMNLGADDYLTKPYTTNQLIAAVAARLEKSSVIEQTHKQNFDELYGKTPINELERLRAQNKILREMLETFIEATDSSAENVESSAQKTLHIRVKSIALLKRIDDFSTKRLSTTTR